MRGRIFTPPTSLTVIPRTPDKRHKIPKALGSPTVAKQRAFRVSYGRTSNTSENQAATNVGLADVCTASPADAEVRCAMSSPRQRFRMHQHAMPDLEPEPVASPTQGLGNKPRSGRAHCSSCQAACCRLTVILQPDDQVPEDLTTYSPARLHMMRRGEDGWCAALNRAHMNCSIYETRPAVCRRFTMNGPYCKTIHTDWSTPVA
jgi:hypothetical protein